MLLEQIRHVCLGLAPLVSLVIVCLTLIWCSSTMTSFSVDSDHGNITQHSISGLSLTLEMQSFNWHPVLMTLAFGFCVPYASILYRISPFSHSTTKLVHLILHSCAIGLILMGLCAVWSFHTAKHITQLYSLHSWCGSLVVSLFLLHYVWSYLVFFSPRLGTNTQRRSWIPVHREAGKSMAFLGALVLLLGIAEKLQFNNSCNLSGWLNGSWVHAYKATDCVYGQTIGLLIMMLIIISFFALSGQQQPNATTAGPDEEDALLH